MRHADPATRQRQALADTPGRAAYRFRENRRLEIVRAEYERDWRPTLSAENAGECIAWQERRIHELRVEDGDI